MWTGAGCVGGTVLCTEFRYFSDNIHFGSLHFSLPFLHALLEIGVERRALAGEDGEGGEDVPEVVRRQAVGLGDGAVDQPDGRPKVLQVRDVADAVVNDTLGRKGGKVVSLAGW